MAFSAEAGGEAEGIGEYDVLYDDRRDEHYVAVAVAEDGVTLRRRDTEYYVPHGIFADWYDSGRIVPDGETHVETPDWIDADRDPSS